MNVASTRRFDPFQVSRPGTRIYAHLRHAYAFSVKHCLPLQISLVKGGIRNNISEWDELDFFFTADLRSLYLVSCCDSSLLDLADSLSSDQLFRDSINSFDLVYNSHSTSTFIPSPRSPYLYHYHQNQRRSAILGMRVLQRRELRQLT